MEALLGCLVENAFSRARGRKEELMNVGEGKTWHGAITHVTRYAILCSVAAFMKEL